MDPLSYVSRRNAQHLRPQSIVQVDSLCYGHCRQSPRPPPPSTRLNHPCCLPVSSVDLHCRIIDDERLCMFLLDPMLTNARIITSTGESSRRVNFRNDVKQRDGGQSVLTGAIEHHFNATRYEYPHMSIPRNLIRDSTSRHSPEVDAVTLTTSLDIDNVRNGLFLNKTGHAGRWQS